jgi:predicted ATPase
MAGEATFPLATLPAPEPAGDLSLDAVGQYGAVRLFLDRAIDVRPDFALTRVNVRAVARICRDLDGIPLALELAAARVRSMSADAIAGHLTDRFALLKGGDPTALPRQQTLRATIDWSYDLLAPAERALLQRLSVFAGGFAFDAAEAVGASDDIASSDVLDALGHLVDRSLVAFDAQTERYRLLETVRQYAQERLAESGEEAVTRDRHLAFYVALAERAGPGMSGPRQTSWRTRLDAEHENILLAFGRARCAPEGGLAGLRLIHGLSQWLGWGYIELWRQVTQQALANPEAQHDCIARCRALYIASQPAYLAGHYEEAFALAQSSVRIARACGNPLELGEALYRLGIAAIAVDRCVDAREHLVEGLALARQAGNSFLTSALSGGLGELYSHQDQLELAESAYLEGLALLHGDAENTMNALNNLARNAIALHAKAKALRYLREAVAAAGSRYTAQSSQSLMRNCSGLAALRKEWTLAIRFSGAAEATRERHGLSDDHVDARFHARDMAPAREALGASAAAEALAAGRAMDVDAALREAEAWLDALPPDEQPP